MFWIEITNWDYIVGTVLYLSFLIIVFMRVIHAVVFFNFVLFYYMGALSLSAIDNYLNGSQFLSITNNGAVIILVNIC